MYKIFRILKMRHTTNLLSFALLIFVVISPNALFAASEEQGKKLLEKRCSSCHRFSGEAKSRFKLKAPDLIWAGSKYQIAWLTNFLQGKEEPLYLKNYRWDQSKKPKKHVAVSKSEARQFPNILLKI
jgi:mono/diheme cytochrome c family protein